MIYEMGSRGLKPIGAHANDLRNNLVPGTILFLNGYDNPQYCIIKNLGISKTFQDYGARYLTVNIATAAQSYKDAYTLKHISKKADDRIQVYITNEVLGADDIINLWQKSEAKRKAAEEKGRTFAADQNIKEAKGRMFFKKHIPQEAQALIVAERKVDESDIQSDYFGSRTEKTVVLGWSGHKRDLFSEMRKHAIKIPETSHLGPGCGHFEARVRVCADFQSNGAYYRNGQYSPWHRELIEERGAIRVFSTHKAAEAWIAKQKPLEQISFDGEPVSFKWTIDEEKIEHREKYSMGAGYYLKDGGRNSTGWSIRKITKHGAEWPAYLCISLAERCIF